MPIFVPVLAAVGGTVLRYSIAGITTYVVGTQIVATVDADAGEKIDEIEALLLENGKTVIEGTAEQLGSISLAFVEGFASALITGVERAYDTVRDKLRGKEDDVIAGFTVGLMAILTLVFLYQSAKKGGA